MVVHPQCLLIISLKMKFETDWSNSSQCVFGDTINAFVHSDKKPPSLFNGKDIAIPDFSWIFETLLETPSQHFLYIREPSNSTLSASSCAPLKTSYQGQENSIKGAILVSKCTDHLRSWKFKMFVKLYFKISNGKLTCSFKRVYKGCIA